MSHSPLSPTSETSRTQHFLSLLTLDVLTCTFTLVIVAIVLPLLLNLILTYATGGEEPGSSLILYVVQQFVNCLLIYVVISRVLYIMWDTVQVLALVLRPHLTDLLQGLERDLRYLLSRISIIATSTYIYLTIDLATVLEVTMGIAPPDVVETLRLLTVPPAILAGAQLGLTLAQLYIRVRGLPWS